MWALLGLLTSGAAASAAVAQPQAVPQYPGPGNTQTPAAATPTPAGTPSPSPTPVYKFVYKATPSPVTTPFPGPGAPEIDEIDLSDSTLVPPANIYGRVLTNTYVVSMSAETMGAQLSIPQTAPGVFSLAASVPDVPPFLRNRSFEVSFAATASNGRVATVTLQLMIK